MRKQTSRRAAQHLSPTPPPHPFPARVRRQYDRTLQGKISVGMLHRMAGSLMLEKPHPVSPWAPTPGAQFIISTLTVEVALVSGNAEVTIDAGELARHVSETYLGHVFKPGQQFAAMYHEGQADQAPVKLTILGFEFADTGTGGGGGAGAGAAPGAPRFGMVQKTTEVQLQKAKNTPIKMVGSSTGKANKLFEKGFNFEEMGIGGLDAQFKEIFRRAFASRLVPPEIMRKMGQNHVRGMLLFGPPGCGKTLIARKIAKALQARPPKIVNGPEILNKYVGQSEENIRALFKDAEAEQAEKGDDSELHIIIFDEFDAIVKQRGSTGGGTGVNDSIVNQLLSKIDGVESLNNVLLIGMTNRKDMIDEAILRPGRLEIHVEIGLPDEPGRRQILHIHTTEIKKNGMFSDDIDLESVAARTKNYTGAEIEGLVKAACSYVFTRQVDITDLSKTPDFKGVQVTMADFERALSETQPAFGVRENELAQCFNAGIISHGADFDRIQSTILRLTAQVHNSDRSSLVSVLLAGPSGVGKSALAARIAVQSGFPFVKRISGESLLSHHEEGKANAVQRAFADAYKSPVSLIILDDIERIMEYVAVGPRFSNNVLQSLLVLVKALPPPGHKLMIIGTTAIPDMLEAMEVTSAFQLRLDVPMLSSESQYRTVLTSLANMSAADVDAVAKHMDGKPLGIKKLLTIIEMARQDDAGHSLPADVPTSAERFYEALVEWGL
jgi:vesicle-fusing ATPase